VFVDGCFWHGCPKHGTRPKGNAAFWRKKDFPQPVPRQTGEPDLAASQLAGAADLGARARAQKRGAFAPADPAVFAGLNQPKILSKFTCIGFRV
jgi:hypothetical protein